MVKVFLIDEHPVTRRGLASVLEMCSGYQVVGDANNLADALPQIEELQPDVVIMDAFGHTGDSIEAISNLHQKCPMVKVLILTDSNKEQDFVKAIRAGVRGYLLKDSDVSQLTDAIRLVAGDGAVVYSSEAAKLFDATNQDTYPFNQLSPREKDILYLVARGHSNKEIATRCYVSEATIKAHLRRITEKLDVKNRAEAVAIAIEKGILKMT